MIREKSRSQAHVLALRLETFSKKHVNVFTALNRAESRDDNDIKFIMIPLVESIEMVVKVRGILVHSSLASRASQFQI